jgi:glycerophosphoryl diester phosphodiesterase
MGWLAGIVTAPARWIHRLLIIVASLVIALSLILLALFVFWDEIAEEITTGRRPVQFHGELATDLLDDYGAVFVVGHNSGGTIAATRQALDHGADVIEIDVASLDGVLVSAHFPPLPLIGRRVFRGPALEDVWNEAKEAEIIKLDLKESSPQFRQLLIAFLDAHKGDHQVIVATRDVTTLRELATRVPEAFRFLSISNRRRLQALEADRQLIAMIDGVTIRHSLIDKETADWLKAERLVVLAWTVNDLDRVNDLVRLGVDAITTDNLAIMELLGGQQRGERFLARRPLPAEPGKEPASDKAKRSGEEQCPGQARGDAPDNQPNFDRFEVFRDEEHQESQNQRGQDEPHGAQMPATPPFCAHSLLTSPQIAALPQCRQPHQGVSPRGCEVLACRALAATNLP